jgi:hypothetical protein
MPVAVSSYKLPVPDLPMVRNRHALKGVPEPVTPFRLIRASGGGRRKASEGCGGWVLNAGREKVEGAPIGPAPDVAEERRASNAP